MSITTSIHQIRLSDLSRRKFLLLYCGYFFFSKYTTIVKVAFLSYAPLFSTFYQHPRELSDSVQCTHITPYIKLIIPCSLIELATTEIFKLLFAFSPVENIFTAKKKSSTGEKEVFTHKSLMSKMNGKDQ